jgi:hypothetical protein
VSNLWAWLISVYPYTRTNAAILHALHLASLVTRYLSISLPFEPLFLDAAHVGRPLIKPNLPFINTNKFREKQVLWLSSTYRRTDPKAVAKYRQYLVAFALLSHSVAYLAWSQGVQGIGIYSGETESSSSDEGQLSSSAVIVPATSVLRLISAMSESPELGQRSHEPPGDLRHLGFSLDVTKVVAAVLATGEPQEEHSDWDLVERL